MGVLAEVELIEGIAKLWHNIITHSGYPNFRFKLITTYEEAQEALRQYSIEAVKHNEFISQMNLSPEIFY